MLNILSRLLPMFSQRSRRRNSRFGAPLSALSRSAGRHRGLFSMGSIAALAAPFIINKLRNRRATAAY